MERLFFPQRRTSSRAGLQLEPEWNLLQPKLQNKIAVIGISRGAGATFASTALAFLLQKSNFGEKSRYTAVPVTYVEMRQPAERESMIFFEAGLDQRFGKGAFSGGEGNEKQLHLHKGINWVVWRQCCGGNGEGEGCRSFRPYPDEMPGAWVIADSPPLDTLRKYDLTVAVIDPLPASVYAGAETYEILRDMENTGLPVLWVVNRDHGEVNHSGLKRFLRLKTYVPLPLLDSRLIYRAQNTCCLPAELMDGETFQTASQLAEQVKERVCQLKPGT